jgi:uncharacterized membrane protein YdbT with pleckstrin-like domain
MDLHPGEEIVFEGRPSWRSILGFYLKGILIAAAAGVIAALIETVALGVAIGVGVFAIVVGIGALKRLATHYMVTTQRLHIRRGILSRHVQQTRLDRVQNVNTNQSLLERMLRVGTVDFDTAGTEDGDFTFHGIAQPSEVVAAVDHAQRAAPADRPTL